MSGLLPNYNPNYQISKKHNIYQIFLKKYFCQKIRYQEVNLKWMNMFSIDQKPPQKIQKRENYD